ncbi:VirB4 family type IV secretion system protein [Paenibacillus sp. Soil522]|uniref:VirB4 family type IV secretion system protein n=1 Tax=Paenibacillus sp. Soil522 TaxID=1736388 RepID=UPI000AE2BF29|nr:DUF87 domain-containing protein [Paenibacillus sp. Soil522]
MEKTIALPQAANPAIPDARPKKLPAIVAPAFSGLLDLISPDVLQFNNKTIQNGELLQRVMVITDYPQRVGDAWLSRIATMPGVVVSIHSAPTDPYDLIEQIKRTMNELHSKLNNGGNPVLMQRTEQQYEDAKHLLKKIDNEQQKVFILTVVLLISADDVDVLNQRTKQIESALAVSGMRGRTPIFQQEQGLRSAGPWGILESQIEALGARNMPVETIAASYPFVYSGLNDGKGTLLGTDKAGGIVVCDFWMRDSSRTNTNMTVMGRPGVGKSTAVKKILLSEFTQGTKIIILDPESEYKELCQNLNGDWIDCGGGVKGRINPLQVRVVPMDEEEEEEPLYGHIRTRGPLALHFQTLRSFFRLYFKDMTRLEEGYLEQAMEDVYRDKGITWETDPAAVAQNGWPTIPDLYFYLVQQSEQDQAAPEWKLLASRLRSAAIGADQALWSGHTTIEADSDFVVLDIHQLLEADDTVRRAQFFNVLSWAWSKIAEDRTQKVLLAVDEAYLLVDPETPQALQFLRNTSKRIRKYEGGLMVITHNMVDFMDPAVQRYGQALIDNPVYKLIMGQGDKDIEALSKLMSLSEKEIQTLTEGKRGEALFVAGNRRLHLKIDVSHFELELFGKAGGR